MILQQMTQSGPQKMFYDLLAIGLGGFLGAITRYLLSSWMSQRFAEFEPSGTLLVNVLGCLIIGILWGMSSVTWIHNGRFGLFLMTGFLGSLTTFSTFGYQTMLLWKQGQATTALINITANLIIGLAAVWIGFLTTSNLYPQQPTTAPTETTISNPDE